MCLYLSVFTSQRITGLLLSNNDITQCPSECIWLLCWSEADGWVQDEDWGCHSWQLEVLILLEQRDVNSCVRPWEEGWMDGFASLEQYQPHRRGQTQPQWSCTLIYLKVEHVVIYGLYRSVLSWGELYVVGPHDLKQTKHLRCSRLRSSCSAVKQWWRLISRRSLPGKT